MEKVTYEFSIICERTNLKVNVGESSEIVFEKERIRIKVTDVTYLQGWVDVRQNV